MEQELLLKAITHSTIGGVILMPLILLLVSLRRELQGGEPLRGMFHVTILVTGLCTFLALMAALFSAKRTAIPEKISQKLDTARLQQLERTAE